MRGRIILTVFWVFSLMLAGGDAQIRAHKQRPVWTMEVIKVKAGELGATLDYLDYHWRRVREEAKREGAVLSYHRIADQGGADTDHAIVLLTQYKDQVTYREREKLFSSIAKSQNLPLVLSLRGNPGMMLDQHADLFETVSTSVYNDYTDPDENVRIVRFQAVY
jgi:hypothetical protein